MANDDVILKLSADVSDINGKLARVTSQFVSLEKTVAKTSGKISGQLAGLGRLFKLDMLVRFGSQLLAVEDQMEQLASAIRDTADRADISTEALQRLRHAADQNGTSAEALDSALVRLNKAIGQARSGAAGMAELFQALGLEDLVKSGANTETVFLGMSEAVSKMGDETQASALVARIMGREADRLIELMKNGAVDVEKLGNELSQVIPEETINKLDTARDKTEEFKKVVNAFAADASGMFIDFVYGLSEVIGWLDRQLAIVAQLQRDWKRLGEIVSSVTSFFDISSGPLADSFNASTAPKSKFTAGGRGLLEAETTSVAAPSFSSSAFNPSSVNPNQAKINRVLAAGNGESAGRRANDDAARASEQYAEAVSELNFQIEQLGRSEEAAAYFEDLRNNLARAGVAIDSERGEQIALLTSQINDMAAAHQAAAEAEAAAAEAGAKWAEMREQAGDVVASAFQNAILEGESLRNTIGNLIQDLARLIFQKMVFDQISSAISGGLSGIVGGKALGGQVNPGNAYMVGEGGPELFVPKVPGSIVPRGKMGGGGVTINSTVNAAPGTNRAELQAMLNQRDADLIRRIPQVMVDKQRRNALSGAF
jgi:hypothetical protein